MTGAVLIVRAAVPVDAPAMAALHVRAWRATYAGILPDDFLAGLKVEDREARWRHSLTAPELAPAERVILVAEEAGTRGGLRRGRSRARRRRVRAGRAVRDQRRSARAGAVAPAARCWRPRRPGSTRGSRFRSCGWSTRNQRARTLLRARGLVARRRDEDRDLRRHGRRTTAATAAPPARPPRARPAARSAQPHAGVRHAATASRWRGRAPS